MGIVFCSFPLVWSESSVIIPDPFAWGLESQYLVSPNFSLISSPPLKLWSYLFTIFLQLVPFAPSWPECSATHLNSVSLLPEAPNHNRGDKGLESLKGPLVQAGWTKSKAACETLICAGVPVSLPPWWSRTSVNYWNKGDSWVDLAALVITRVIFLFTCLLKLLSRLAQ